MVALKAHEVARFLDRPEPAEGLFLVYGPDAGLVRETSRRLARRLCGDDPESMNLVVLDGSELDADPSRLAVEARTPSLFGDRRVVRVRGAGKGLVMILAELRDALGAAIILEAGNLPPRDPLRALVEGARLGRALPCYPDSDESLGRLIAETFAKAGVQVEPEAVAVLRDSLGSDREVTRRELEKLVLFAETTRRLSREDVLALTADSAALALDAVADAMAAGHAPALDAALERALSAAVNPQQLLTGALLHFATLRRWRAEVEAGRSIGDVLDAARPKPHFSRRQSLERQLRLWSLEGLAGATERLQAGIADSRRLYGLAGPLAQRAMLAVCLAAAER